MPTFTGRWTTMTEMCPNRMIRIFQVKHVRKWVAVCRITSIQKQCLSTKYTDRVSQHQNVINHSRQLPSVRTFLKPAFDWRRQRQTLNVIDSSMLANNKATEILQGSDLRKPRHRTCQTHRKRRRPESTSSWVAENSGLRIVDWPLDEFHNGLVAIGAGLRVQAERTLTMLDPCVQRSAVRPKAEAE